MKEQNRYALVHRYEKGDYLRIIDFKQEDDGYVWNTNMYVPKTGNITKGKHTLAEIDKFTNWFASSDEMFNLVLGDVYERNPEDIYILYRHEGYKALNVHFGNKELSEKASEVINATIIDPKEINEMTELLTNKKSRFFRFLASNQESFTIYDSSLFKLVMEIRTKKDFSDGTISDTYGIYDDMVALRKKLTNYKLYREVFLAKQSYYEYLEEKNKKPSVQIQEFKGFTCDNNGQMRMFEQEPPKAKVKKLK